MKKILIIFATILFLSCHTQKEVAKMWEGYSKEELITMIGYPCAIYNDSIGGRLMYNYKHRWHDFGKQRFLEFTLDKDGVIVGGKIIKLKNK